MRIEIKDGENGTIQIEESEPARIDIESPGLFPDLTEIQISGTSSTLTTARTAIVNTLPVIAGIQDVLRIEILAPGLDPQLITIAERGLPGPPGPGGSGSGNAYFPQGWS